MKQMTFASAAWSAKSKTTRRERFLAEMNAVIPWARLVALVEPHYSKAGNGLRPMPLERMLRVYFMLQWFNLSEPQAEDALYDIELMRRFAGGELDEDGLPDETTILRFRHLLEMHRLTEAMFADIRDSLEKKGLQLKSGTIVDATIINALSSTKNAEKERDPDQAYWREDHRQHCKHAIIRYRVNRRARPGRKLTGHEKSVNRSRSRRRALSEFAFQVVKRLRGFAKVRYRGLQEHGARTGHVCAVELVSRATTIVVAKGFVRPVKRGMHESSTETRQNERLGRVSPSLQHQSRE